MKRTVPLLITFIAGVVLIVSFFVPSWEELGENAAVWFDVLAAIAFILGGGNLMKLQLKKISDRAPGWGYAAVTLLTFLLTLTAGLFKIGSSAAANTEFYGETFVPLALSELPVYSVAGTLQPRADGAPLPKSVRRQFSLQSGRLVFRGWMLPDQKFDLVDYQDHLSWRAAVENLAEVAQPPQGTEGIEYYPNHQCLSFAGFMTDETHQLLLDLFDGSPTAQAAVDRLYEASHRVTKVPVPDQPEDFAIPPEQQNVVFVADGELHVRGPLTPLLRDQLRTNWTGEVAVRPFGQRDRTMLIQQIESRGIPLTPQQRMALDAVVSSIWTADALIQSLDAAGLAEPTPKTYRELYQEMLDGVDPLEPNHPTGESTSLNNAQKDLVRTFAANESITADQLVRGLYESGPLTEKMAAAVGRFLESQPTQAEFYRELWLALERSGPLSVEQQEFLLGPYRDQFAWDQAVGRLFVASQQVKYPWSGNYNEEGSLFWWLYEYIFQPLLTTTFAMLAFYVASAAYRAFRAKNLEAVLLLGTAFIILLGRTFAGYALTAWIPDYLSALRIDQLTVYIMAIFNTAGNRAIMIGIALGIASTSLKVLLGVDRSYLGSGGE